MEKQVTLHSLTLTQTSATNKPNCRGVIPIYLSEIQSNPAQAPVAAEPTAKHHRQDRLTTHHHSRHLDYQGIYKQQVEKFGVKPSIWKQKHTAVLAQTRYSLSLPCGSRGKSTNHSSAFLSCNGMATNQPEAWSQISAAAAATNGVVIARYHEQYLYGFLHRRLLRATVFE